MSAIDANETHAAHNTGPYPLTEPVIRYYGWSALSVQTADGTLYFDPFFRRYCDAQWFDADTFDDAKYICVTHGHEEHFLDVPGIAVRTGATVIAPTAATRFLRKRRGISDSQLRTLNAGESAEMPGFRVSAFNWKHRDINLTKAISKALFQGNFTQLSWAWSSATQAPFYCPYTGYHIQLRDGPGILNYNEGFNSKMTDREINELGERFQTDILLAGMQLNFVDDVVRGIKALKPNMVILYPPHEKFHEMMGAESRPWAEFASAAQLAAPAASIICAAPGTTVTAATN